MAAVTATTATEVKAALKAYQRDFRRKHQRDPGRQDIDADPFAVELYHRYAAIKASATGHPSPAPAVPVVDKVAAALQARLTAHRLPGGMSPMKAPPSRTESGRKRFASSVDSEMEATSPALFGRVGAVPSLVPDSPVPLVRKGGMVLPTAPLLTPRETPSLSAVAPAKRPRSPSPTQSPSPVRRLLLDDDYENYKPAPSVVNSVAPTPASPTAIKPDDDDDDMVSPGVFGGRRIGMQRRGHSYSSFTFQPSGTFLISAQAARLPSINLKAEADLPHVSPVNVEAPASVGAEDEAAAAEEEPAPPARPPAKAVPPPKAPEGAKHAVPAKPSRPPAAPVPSTSAKPALTAFKPAAKKMDPFAFDEGESHDESSAAAPAPCSTTAAAKETPARKPATSAAGKRKAVKKSITSGDETAKAPGAKKTASKNTKTERSASAVCLASTVSDNFVRLKLGKGKKFGRRGGGGFGFGFGYGSGGWHSSKHTLKTVFRGAVAHRPAADTNEAEAAAILQALAPPIRPASTATVPDEEQPADLHPACSEICDVAPWWTTRTNADGGGPAAATTVDLTVALWRLARLTSFRPGQVEAIRRVLQGKSTLLLLGTGAGKSLCFQLPALVLSEKYKALTIVVTPLVALMEDHMRRLPLGLRGAALHGNLPAQTATMILNKASRGELDVLFMSPEKLMTAAVARRLRTPATPIEAMEAGSLRVGLVCIDEIHCASEWSHNFRPSYLRLGEFLRTKLSADCCLLGLSATLTAPAQATLERAFGLGPDTVIRGPLLRDNLMLTASIAPADAMSRGAKRSHQHRRAQLLKLLRTHFAPTDAVIVYCTRQCECWLQAQVDEIAGYLQSNGINAAPYHAGRTAFSRTEVQSGFATGSISVVVATIAFGLGIDKADVRGVIHYSLPKSLENYVQEVGRAGRDGLPALCHVFVDAADHLALRALSLSSTADPVAVRKLLEHLFPCPTPKSAAPRTALAAVDGGDLFGLKRETLETVLTMLEQHPLRPLRMLPLPYTTCSVRFYKAPTPSHPAHGHPLVRAIVAHGTRPTRKMGDFRALPANLLLVPLIQLEQVLSATTHDVLEQLDALRAQRHLQFELGEEGFAVERLHWPPSAETVAQLASDLTQTMSTMDRATLSKLDHVYAVMHAAAQLSDNNGDGNEDGPEACKPAQRAALAAAIEDYYGPNPGEPTPPTNFRARPEYRKRLVAALAEIKVLVISQAREDKRPWSAFRLCEWWIALALARILHGISTPWYPARDWSKHRVWGRYADVDIVDLCKLAQQVLSGQQIQPLQAAA